MPAAGFIADSQASPLAQLTGADEATIRTGVALLLAGLIEAGSCAGVHAGGCGDPTQPTMRGPNKRVNARMGSTGLVLMRSNAGRKLGSRWLPLVLSGHVRPMLTSVAGRVRRVSKPCTETRFGRDFSATIVELGGAKVKRRDRAYYDGVSLVMDGDGIEAPAPLRA